MGRITIKQETVTPQTPTTGNRVVYPKADGWYEMNDQGVERALFSNDNVYGADYLFSNDVYEGSNTSTSFQTYTGFAYPSGLALSGRKYEITFNSLIRYSSSSRNHICRVAIDGETLEEEIGYEVKDTGRDIREPISYKYVVDGSELQNAGGFIDYDFKAQNSGDTSRVYSCTLTFKRVL